MKKSYRIPGVFIEEVSLQPRLIAQVETAIPAFIGYTEKSIRSGTSVLNQPTRISSFLEFEQIFGKAFPSKFEMVPALPSDQFPIKLNKQLKSLSFLPNQQGFLYYSVKAYFENGGSTCVIVSVGNYAGQANLIINKSDLLRGLTALANETESSILAIPDAVLLGDLALHVYQQMLEHCGVKRNRFAILDIPDRFKSVTTGNECVSDFRDGLGNQNLEFGAAYYPWLHSSIASTGETEVLGHFELLDLRQILPEPNAQTFLNSTPTPAGSYLHQGIKNLSATYLTLMEGIQKKLGLLPPSGFIAGVFARTDRGRGVWKAPANVSLNSVYKPAVSISVAEQDDLTIHPSGKSINAIREFSGKGILVWGARSLAGNDSEWRYIPVKRTTMMIELSIRNGLKYVSFEPNELKTWIGISSSCSNFLADIWKAGGLAGAKPEEAFFVKVGLGKSMTVQDVLNKRLVIAIGLAIVRPAEFIILRIEMKTA